MMIRGKFVSQKTIERFWSRVDIRDEDDCWEWQAGKNGTGKFNYGIYWINGGSALAHRLALSFYLKLEVLADEVLHTCDNPPCCNPHHLRAGTHSDNMRDMITKGRRRTLRGVETPQAKLNDDKIRRIRKLSYLHKKYKKYTYSELARMFEVDKALISRIVSRVVWKHVGD